LGDFFLRQGLVDEILVVDKKSGPGRKAALARLWRERWNVVLVPHQSVRTALWMSRVHADEKVSFRTWWNFPFFSRRVVRPLDLPDALRQLSLMAPVDSSLAERFATDEIETLKNPIEQSPLRLVPPPEWASMQVLTPKPDGRRIYMAPGSVWATKRWSGRGYEEVARALLTRGFEVILVGSPDERELCAAIAAHVPGVQNQAGKTSLADLVSELARGTAMICNDSGAMHAAAAAGLPTVAVFGPTTLDLGFRPWNSRAVVVQKILSCRPCGKHGPQVCPIGTHECMQTLPAAEVLKALDQLLK
jgi:heptosyltransferase-2